LLRFSVIFPQRSAGQSQKDIVKRGPMEGDGGKTNARGIEGAK